jgi:hypothetical protein
MALEATLSPDCKSLTIAGGTDWIDAEFEFYFHNELNSEEVIDPPGSTTNSGTTNIDIEYLDNTGSLVLTYLNIPSATSEELNGIMKVVCRRYDSSGDLIEEISIGIVGNCKLNCCIAKKVKELVSCTCGTCKECVSILDEASKIFLLSKGMEINLNGCVQTQALFKKTIEEYDKAIEICGLEDCDCNC